MPEADARNAEELDDLRKRLDVFGAFMGGIVFEFDHEYRFVRVWTAHPGLLAAPAEAVIGLTVREAIGDHPGAIFEEAATRVEATGQPTAFDYMLDVPAGRRAFSAELRLREPTDGGRRTYTMVTRDVTEAKELEGKLLQAERLAALGLLAASVGHEIRQPLSYVLASLEVMERELANLPLNERASTSLSNIRTGSRRIAEIAASLDLLAGRRKRTSAPIDVRVPLQAALDLCASELASHTLERDTPELPRVRGDESELCQVFANLLLNAAQAIDPLAEGGAPQVTVRSTRVGEQVRVMVSDTGSGILPEHLAHVFDPFFTTKDKGRGTGLGLFISRGIVEAQGGTLHVTSQAGKGTTVEVLLQIADPAPSSRAPAASVHPDEPRRRLGILLVDDEPRFLESLRLALEPDHDVEIQGRGAEALTLLETRPTRYDLVLCDLAMPDLDGAAFFERMKQLGVADRFILMTGGAVTPRAADFIAAKTCPMIAKPFLLEDLLALLDSVARKQRRRAAAR